MRTDWQTAGPQSDRDQISKAREAAEALFKPAPQIERPPPATPLANGNAAAVPQPAPAEPQAPRKPRIIAIPSMLTSRERNPEPPQAAAARLPEASPKPAAKPAPRRKAPKVSTAEYGRVRALATYGMTVEQVADLYQVPVAEIERITRTAEDEAETRRR